MSQEEQNLATHVEICAIRYKGIQEKFNDVEKRLDKLEDSLAFIKKETSQGFADIKLLLEQRNTGKQTAVIAAAATVIAAMFGAIGYIIVKL